ncbi:MAG TPA: hypothetical protein VGH24_07785 [Solirubrobacteraceae bacterium]|jgi:hypothetical protein
MRTAGLILASALLLVACGSSSSNSAAARLGQPVVFAKCMRAHGVPNFPDPGSNGSGGMVIQARAGTPQNVTVNGVSVNAPAFRSAMQTCRSKLPGGGTPPPLSASRKAAILKFAQCMRAHGLTNFPDPAFQADGRIGLTVGAKNGLDPSSPAFQRAQAACGPLQKGGGAQVRVP